MTDPAAAVAALRGTIQAIDPASADLILRDARTFSDWLDKPVADDTLKAAYELAKWGATSAGCSPLRIVFVRTPEGKAKLKPALADGNVDKTMAAPVCAIFAHDTEFYEQLPTLFPHADARSWFVGNDALIAATAFRNGTLQAAYFMLAARAVGLDCGPMSGFDASAVDAAFFEGTPVRANFLCNLGYGDPGSLFPRGPRLGFNDACRLA
ncbi:MAG: malonic semialdehyde reductase [Pseudomonadota bacterium]